MTAIKTGILTPEDQTIDGRKTFSAVSIFPAGIVGNVTGNITGNITGNVTGSSGSCTGNAATATVAATATNFIVPTVDPAIPGALWNDAGTLKVSV